MFSKYFDSRISEWPISLFLQPVPSWIFSLSLRANHSVYVFSKILYIWLAESPLFRHEQQNYLRFFLNNFKQRTNIIARIDSRRLRSHNMIFPYRIGFLFCICPATLSYFLHSLFQPNDVTFITTLSRPVLISDTLPIDQLHHSRQTVPSLYTALISMRSDLIWISGAFTSHKICAKKRVRSLIDSSNVWPPEKLPLIPIVLTQSFCVLELLAFGFGKWRCSEHHHSS